MSNANVAPDYAWICHACAERNPAGKSRCEICNCPSHATTQNIDFYRPNTPIFQPLRALLPFVRQHWLESLVVGAGSAVLIGLPLLSVLRKNLSDAGLLGDFVGGYIGTFFALASVALLLATLRNQLRASKQQNFENKYFELIKMHRDNVAEFHVGEKSGRKVFVSIMREFQAILKEVRRFSERLPFSQDELLHIAYYALFFGVGPNSSRMLRSSLTHFDSSYVDALAEHLNRDTIKKAIRRDADLDYEPVDGHQSRLGHYYRHLYQTVSYVDRQGIRIDKYEYVKTIRAQLTNYEQALLLVNSLTPLGKNWWQKGLIKKYRIVQNIPRDFFDKDVELDIGRFFTGKDDFEWQEQSA